MKEKNYNVSIIVPIFNVEKWLTRCLNSICKQTYGEFEVLLIDDGSIDNSGEICQAFVSKDNRFKYYKKENGGLSDTRNYGINRAKGKYLIFVDSDDYLTPDYVEMLYSGIQKNNVDAVICGIRRVDEDGKILNNNCFNVTDKTFLSGKEIIELSFDNKSDGGDLVCAWNKIYDRKLFENNLRFEKGRYYEDGYIFPNLFLRVNKAMIIHRPLYNYVQRNNSIIHSSMNIKKIKDDDASMLSWINLFKNVDKKLYILSIQKYKNWIIYKWYENRNIILNNNMGNYLQKQYRLYAKEKYPMSVKSKIKDTISIINLDIVYYLKIILGK